MSRSAFGTVLGSFLSLLLVGIFATKMFVLVMYNNEKDTETYIEGVSFAMQTLTTVGYGNWETPRRTGIEEFSRDKILTMRGISSAFMFAGATLYAIFTSTLVNLLVELSRPRRV